MPDRSDPTRPSARGPWPEWRDLGQIYDHGAPWCVNRRGHPGDHGYPDAQLHQPIDECRSPAFSLQAHNGLDDEAVSLEIYLARAFRFGYPREAVPRPTRVVLDYETSRIALELGDALRAAQALGRLVALTDVPPAIT